MQQSMSILLIILLSYFAMAKDIIITVGKNNDTVFDPQEVNATVGDAVRFLFVQGNHSATQSTFAEPCIPIHESNQTINGFDSGLRLGTNGTGQTDLVVPIGAANVNDTIWIFDAFPGSCGEGHIAGINVNDTSEENFDAAVRNAKRLNGTEASQTSSAPSQTHTSPSSGSSNTSSSSGSGSDSGDAMRILIPLVASSAMAIIGGALLLS
jgi:hypothetical protein